MPRRSTVKMALDYARRVLGYKEPAVFGQQLDPAVPGTAAVWVRCEAEGIEVGLIVSIHNGVLDEFDPTDCKPGTLKQKAELALLDFTMEVL